MENKELHSKADEPSASSYKIIKYVAAETPKDYRNMLLSKYLRQLRQKNDFFGQIDAAAYFATQPPFFETLLCRPQAKIRLAVLSDNHDVVLGWSLMEPNKLHFVYVGFDYRNLGIAKALVPEPFSVVTHYTRQGIAILKGKFPETIFNPYA